MYEYSINGSGDLFLCLIMNSEVTEQQRFYIYTHVSLSDRNEKKCADPSQKQVQF